MTIFVVVACSGGGNDYAIIAVFDTFDDAVECVAQNEHALSSDGYSYIVIRDLNDYFFK